MEKTYASSQTLKVALNNVCGIPNATVFCLPSSIVYYYKNKTFSSIPKSMECRFDFQQFFIDDVMKFLTSLCDGEY